MSEHHPATYAAARSELFTVRDLLRFAVSRFAQAKLFFGHGTATAWDEAVYLTLHALHLPPHQLEPFLDARLTTAEREAVLGMIGRRCSERVPAAYLTHEAWLGEHRFYVDERVIVPRSFIAELLREDLQPWMPDCAEVTRALDLCTGSGCLAILTALACPNARVDAVDLSDGALAVAARNIADYGLTDRVRPVHSDLFAALAGERYELIVCNPPYVTAASMAALPAEYLAEPRMALASGEDGLDHVRTILATAAEHLTDEGLLIVEVGFNRAGVEAAFPDVPVTWVETSAGDGVVFLVTRGDLMHHR